MKPLTLLLSAYACEPNRGSEPGIGWRWALEMARLGHTVVVLTRRNNREVIERWLTDHHDEVRALHLHFEYYDLPDSVRRWKGRIIGVHMYFSLWQFFAYRVARDLHQQWHFDAVHHITFGVIRQSSFMGGLGVPMVVGPLGGGEMIPSPLMQHFSLRSRLHEYVRTWANSLALFHPMVRRMYRQAGLILMKSTQSLHWLPQVFQHKAEVRLELGIEPFDRAERETLLAETAENASSGLSCLYVGRFIALKGMVLALRAIAAARHRGLDATLTLIGQGPLEPVLKKLAKSLGISEYLTWIPWMERSELMACYKNYDVFLFPSLRDSSGNVLVEAMSYGVPVVCLELGGPAEIVNSHCGRIIPVEGRDETEVVIALAAALQQLAQQPSLRHLLKIGALNRAQDFFWPNVVAGVWGEEGIGTALVKRGIPESEV